MSELEKTRPLSPIPELNPLLVNIRSPCMLGCEPNYTLQVNNNILWQFIQNKSSWQQMVVAMEKVLQLLGYQLTDTGLHRLVKNCLAVKASRLKNRLSKTRNGGMRKQIRDGWSTQQILEEEVLVTPKDVIECKDDDIQSLHETIQNLHGDLEEEAASLFEALKAQKELNEELALIQKDTRMKHHGRVYSDVGDKQKLRQMKHIKERTNNALWFAESFGLVPTSVQFRGASSDTNIEVSLEDKDHSSGMYLLEGCQKAIDAEWHDVIKHTPGSMPGAELPFKTTMKKMFT